MIVCGCARISVRTVAIIAHFTERRRRRGYRRESCWNAKCQKMNAAAAKIAKCDFQIGFSAFLEWRQKAATPQNPQI